MTELFTVSLMIDDIGDGSRLRRGLPAAHAKYGLSQTVNSVTYTYGTATVLVNMHLHPGCMGVMLESLISSSKVLQGLDLNWILHQKCPTVSEYLVMVDHRTGGFFQLALQLMQVEAGAPLNPKLIHLMTLVGRYYQIWDDY
ncbi:polyprenyl synthetase family protein [Aspergillus tanneri]|uniref:Geranylgeranyl pyrophosphate synthase n=1 Tax=Aspergillus tanneri TaxID=1220188 RepID=A0A5M9M4P8_9EURO|nr:Geranylgeranyl pyrophosphate synthase [Aspergillus tanneri]KAA8641982.1 Geranylgeranyl pyrophosphate synthase [Aspergillus tanneri]